jgi:uncharacterized protein with HEPN domain
MHSDALGVLSDVEHHVSLAQQFVAGSAFEIFLEDTRTIYAVIRCLEIISEASRRLPDDLKARHPSIPWRDIAGAGNIYRHEYEDVEARIVWNTVQSALPPLLKAVREEIERLSGSN